VVGGVGLALTHGPLRPGGGVLGGLQLISVFSSAPTSTTSAVRNSQRRIEAVHRSAVGQSLVRAGKATISASAIPMSTIAPRVSSSASPRSLRNLRVSVSS